MTAVLEPDVAKPTRSRRRRGVRRAARGILLLVALLAAYLVVTFVQVYRASTHDGARSADAIIVLGAAQYDGRPSPVLQKRLDHALALYRAGLARRIVVTGGRQEGDRFTEATSGYLYLRDHGVPDSAILREVQGSSTWESLAATGRILGDRGLARVVLVTDDYHAYRAEAIAEGEGLDTTVSPVDPGLTGTQELRELVRETGAVALGRIIGFDRLVKVDDAVSP